MNTKVVSSERRLWSAAPTGYFSLGSPLVPLDETCAVYRREVERTRPAKEHHEVLMLGVTPAVANAGWEEGTTLTAVDRCPEMIENVWPGDREGIGEAARTALCVDWREMPYSAKFHAAVGDAPMSNMETPEGYRELAATLHKVLAPGGKLVLRHFLGHSTKRDPAAVISGMRDGRYANFHQGKLDLLMALQPDPDTGVVLGDAWEYWINNAPGPDELAVETGWPDADIASIGLYDRLCTVLFFPSLRTLCGYLEPWFSLTSRVKCAYPEGVRSPVLVWTRNTL